MFATEASCGHMVCIGCMVQHVRTALGDKTLIDKDGLHCPHGSGCTTRLDLAKMKCLRRLSEEALQGSKGRPLSVVEAERFEKFMEEACCPCAATPQSAGPLDSGSVAVFVVPSNYATLLVQSIRPGSLQHSALTVST